MVAVRLALIGAAFAVALSISLWPTTGQAYTAEEEQACRPDAFRLCSSEIPDIDRVTACMVRNKSQLSPECRRFFGPSPQAAAPGKPMSIKPMSIKPTAARKSKSKKKPKPDDT